MNLADILGNRGTTFHHTAPLCNTGLRDLFSYQYYAVEILEKSPSTFWRGFCCELFQLCITFSVSLSRVSCRLFTMKWAGNPDTPSSGTSISLLQLGHRTCCFPLQKLSKQQWQKECRQGRARDFWNRSRQIPHSRKSRLSFSTRVLLAFAMFNQ